MEVKFQTQRQAILMRLFILVLLGLPMTGYTEWQINSSIEALGNTNSRNTEPKQGDTELSGQLTVLNQDTTGTLQRNINYSLSRSLFLEETNQDTSENTGNINISWLPNSQLRFALDHVASNRVADSRLQDIPDNRQQQNTTELSGSYAFLIDNTNRLNFRLSVIYNTQEENNNDSYRYGISTSYQRNHTRHWQSSFIASNSEVKFTDLDNRNYDVQDLSYELNYLMSKSRVTLSLGYNLLSRETGEDFNGSTLGLLWQYNLNRGGLLEINAEKRLTDTSIGLTNTNNISQNQSISNNRSGAQIEESSIIYIAFRQALSARTSLSTRFSYEHNKQQTSLREDKSTGFSASISHNFSRELIGLFNLQGDKQKQIDNNSERENKEISFGLQKIYSPRFSTQFNLGYSAQTNSPQTITDKLENGFYIFRLNYRLL